MGTPRARRSGRRGATLTVSTVPTKLARQQIAALRGKTKASFLLAVQEIHRRGCAAAGVRLAGEALSGICRLDLYGAHGACSLSSRRRTGACCCLWPSTRARPILIACCTQRSASTSPRNLGPSHRAAMPKDSHRSNPTSSSDSSAACEISATCCPPTPGHPLADAANPPLAHHAEGHMS